MPKAGSTLLECNVLGAIGCPSFFSFDAKVCDLEDMQSLAEGGGVLEGKGSSVPFLAALLRSQDGGSGGGQEGHARHQTRDKVVFDAYADHIKEETFGEVRSVATETFGRLLPFSLHRKDSA